MNLRQDVEAYSAEIGKNPLLVQAGGGNTSWKSGNELWVKASGTWLAQAQEKDIFVGLQLDKVTSLIAASAQSYVEAILLPTAPRPSIETAFHALHPFTVVAHMHAVDAIATMIQPGGKELLYAKLGTLAPLVGWVEYAKPGLPLAQALQASMRHQGVKPCYLMQNHGILVGAASVGELRALLGSIMAKIALVPLASPVPHRIRDVEQWAALHYMPAPDARLHAFALSPARMRQVKASWVLYPDHALFLGAEAFVWDKTAPSEFARNAGKPPALVFIPGQGVVIHTNNSTGEKAMIECFTEVLSRTDENTVLSHLSDGDINELLHWEAEHYRLRQSK